MKFLLMLTALAAVFAPLVILAANIWG